MRSKRNNQGVLQFQSASLEVTRKHFARYAAISKILDGVPEIVDAVHRDLAKTVKHTDRRRGPGRECNFSSDTILRALICQVVEGEDLRGIVIRIDDSTHLRQFTRIHDGPVMDASTLCRFKNAIRLSTWKKVNRILAQAAIEDGRISGERLRLDTTAFETNVHYPSDSWLLWDTYRVLARLIRSAREIDPELVGNRRLHPARVKGLAREVSRKAAKKGSQGKDLIRLYKPLLTLVEAICDWSESVAIGLSKSAASSSYSLRDTAIAEFIADEAKHYVTLGRRVIDQCRRRIFEGESVPAKEKLYSIFEPHTELLKRGKAGKPIEFGHMILLQQVEGRFITDYTVFSQRPMDRSLVDPALRSHEELFGSPPQELATDKGFYESPAKIDMLAEDIPMVAIPKPGRRSDSEHSRETSLAFKLAQAFRAGVEGTISYLKRALRMFRCFNKGWEHYVATVGATIFAHNLVVLAGTG